MRRPAPRTARRGRPRRAFSLIDMLLALAISSAALAATLQALQVSFLNYQHVTDTASSHVVARIVMHRTLALIRTGTDFGPFPADVLQNPRVESEFIEFVTSRDDAGNPEQITRIEYRDGATAGELGSLWLVLVDAGSGEEQEQPMLEGVENARFSMLYDVGPRLVSCTVDIAMVPDDTLQQGVDTDGDDVVDDREEMDVYGTADDARRLRLVASAAPRHDR